MDKIEQSRVAETILAAPGWARVGLSAPTGHLRLAAAHELARAILEDAGQGDEEADEGQLGLTL